VLRENKPRTLLEISIKENPHLMSSQDTFGRQNSHFARSYVDSQYILNTMSLADVKPVNLLLLSTWKRKITWEESRDCKLLKSFFLLLPIINLRDVTQQVVYLALDLQISVIIL